MFLRQDERSLVFLARKLGSSLISVVMADKETRSEPMLLTYAVRVTLQPAVRGSRGCVEVKFTELSTYPF
jgi:hypothetical protein